MKKREVGEVKEKNSKEDFLLEYDETAWREKPVSVYNTLQLFITDKCNKRCPECFYGNMLGTKSMPFGIYKKYLKQYCVPENNIGKIILLGGEPTLHNRLSDMIRFNADRGLKTTVYTNGANLAALEGVMKTHEEWVTVRVGVHGLTVSEKPLTEIVPPEFPVTVVYMLANYNQHELMAAAEYAEKFNCNGFYISSIREIDKTGDYWLDTEKTIPIQQYARIAQIFMKLYRGNIRRIHLATRGVLITKNQDFTDVTRCRFGNILRDGRKIISPFDISLNKTSPELSFDKEKCSRHHKCVLQKIVLERV